MEPKKDLNEEGAETIFSLYLTFESPIPVTIEIFPHFKKDRRELVRNDLKDPNLTSIEDIDYRSESIHR
jgi:hypothetical protein